MSGSSGNTSSGNARPRAPRNDNADITRRHDHDTTEEPLGADVTEAAGGAGQQQRDIKHPAPDDANAAARREPDR